MADQKCPNCGSVLSLGLEEPDHRGGIETYAAPRYVCTKCFWSSAQDQPGTEGGDNGGS